MNSEVTPELQGITQLLESYRQSIIEDIRELIAIPSIEDFSTIGPNAPFGQPVRKAFDALIKMAERESFVVKDFDGYAIDIEIGEGDRVVGILNHIDVVSEGNLEKWKTPPYQLSIVGNHLYGRGVTDNKGPLVTALYCLKAIKELNIPLNKRIRLIVGGAEETSWDCIRHYFKHREQPDVGFSPDGDFPLVNGEKGILVFSMSGKSGQSSSGAVHNIRSITSGRDLGTNCCQMTVIVDTNEPALLLNQLANGKATQTAGSITIEYDGIKTKSRNPQRGINSAVLFAEDFSKVAGLGIGQPLVNFLNTYCLKLNDGESIGLNCDDQDMGAASLCLTSTHLAGDEFEVFLDYRYPQSQPRDKVVEHLQHIADNNGLQLKIHKTIPAHFIKPNSKLIKVLSSAYETVTGEKCLCMTKGGASYARMLRNGVAFGPTFPNVNCNTHMENESLDMDAMIKAMCIYLAALIQL